MEFKDKLKKIRLEKNITQTELAESVFVSMSIPVSSSILGILVITILTTFWFPFISATNVPSGASPISLIVIDVSALLFKINFWEL